VHGFATQPVANWNKFNSCSGTCLYKQQSATWDANKSFVMQ